MSSLYLGDDSQLRTQVMESNGCYIEAVNADFTLCGLQDAKQTQGHGRFASPSAAHDPHLQQVERSCQGKAQGSWDIPRTPLERLSRHPY